MKKSIKFIFFGIFVFFVLSPGPANVFAESTLKFDEASYYSSKLDKACSAMRMGEDSLYIAGSQIDSNSKALSLTYQMPLKKKSPRHFLWQSEPGLLSSDVFTEVAGMHDGLYFTGQSSILKNKKSVPILAKFSSDQASHAEDAPAPVWVSSAQPLNAADLNGVYLSVLPVREGEKTFLYTAGFVSKNDTNHTAVLAKYDTKGTLLWAKALTDETALHRGVATRLASEGGFIYVAGYAGECKKDKYFDKISPDLTLWKFDSAGGRLWVKTDTSVKVYLSKGELKEAQMSLLADAENLFVLTTQKKSSKTNLRLIRYDQDGNPGWNISWDAMERDGFSDRSFATDMAVGRDRLYVCGWTAFTDKKSEETEEDIFILEVDKAHGFILASEAYGKPDKNERASAIQKNDENIFIAGTRASISDKNKLNTRDIMLLTYKVIPPLEVTIAIEPDLTGKKIKPKDGKIIVAVMSDSSFDAPKEIYTKSLTFGPIGNEPTFSSCGMKDINNDGRLDLYCYFKDEFKEMKIDKKLFKNDDSKGILKGNTFSGIPIIGSQPVEMEAAPIITVAPPVDAAPPVPVLPLISADQVISPPQEPVLVPAVQTAPVETAPAPSLALSPVPVTQNLSPDPTVAPLVVAAQTVTSTLPISTNTTSVPIIPADGVTSANTVSAVTVPATPSPVIPVPSAASTSVVVPQTAVMVKDSVPAKKSEMIAAATRLITEASSVQALVSKEAPENGQMAKDSDVLSSNESSDTASNIQGSGLVEVYNDMGLKEIQSGNLDKAVEYLKEALRLEPRSFDANKYMGLAYAKAGKVDIAKGYYSKALELKPDDDSVIQLLTELKK